MTIQQQLREAGYEKLAMLYNEQTISAIKDMMRIIIMHPDIGYSTLKLMAYQLLGISHIHPTTEKLVWADVHVTLEEFLILEKESNFPYRIDDENIALYRKAAEGQVQSMVDLAHSYRLQGYDDQAYMWYKLAAKLNHAAAIYWVGNYMYIGEVVEQDLQAVFLAYERAAKLGHADAANNLGDMYLKGEFVEQDDEKAYLLFKQAADAGVAESMYTMGYLYGTGRGVELDAELSAYWYERSALNGDVFAINKMGHQAFEQDQGEKALFWYLQAANQQDVEGEYNVGFCYESGIGTAIDLKKAKYWYHRAALQGDELSKLRLKGLTRG
ncbi:MAG: sel1 repeat family protein [Kurthia sp.]|nr:sel1 repeat family protein [Candidatus Kurthia equi]